MFGFNNPQKFIKSDLQNVEEVVVRLRTLDNLIFTVVTTII